MLTHTLKNYSPNQKTESLLSIALILMIVLVAVTSLTPVQLVSSWDELKAAVAASMKLSEQGLLQVTIAERVVMFLPLGLLTYWRLVKHRRPEFQASILVGTYALMIELAQAVLSTRHPRVADFLFAATAGMAGVMFGFLMAPLRSTLLRLLLLLVPGFVVLGNLAIFGLVTIAHRGASIEGWDCSYPLLVANELTQDRPWKGRIWGVALYAREFTTEEIQRLSHIPITSEQIQLRIKAGAFAIYDFTFPDRNRVPQRVAGGPAVDLVLPVTDPPTWRSGQSGLDIQSPTLIRSIESASEICETITQAQAFTIETRIASSDLRQGGPARIVSMSQGPSLRNFTLGEEDGSLVFRVRSYRNGENGANVPYRTDREALTGGAHHIVASYARGTARIFVDGREASPPLHHYDAVILGSTSRAVRTDLAAGALALFMGAITVVVVAGQPVFVMLLLVLGATAFVPSMGSILITTWFGHNPNLTFFVAVTCGSALGLAGGLALQRLGSD